MNTRKLRIFTFLVFNFLITCHRNIIQRNAEQSNYQARPCKKWFVNYEKNAKRQTHEYVQNRHNGITKSFVRSFGIGLFFSQNKNADNGEYIKHNGNKRDHVEQVAIPATNAPDTREYALYP
jgi:hypothetical protein